MYRNQFGEFVCAYLGLNILRDLGTVSQVGRKGERKFSSTGERAPGYRLSPNYRYFQKFKQMPAPDWAQKMLCIIVPNQQTVCLEKNSLNTFFNKMYRDQFGEFVCVYLGLKG